MHFHWRVSKEIRVKFFLTGPYKKFLHFWKNCSIPFQSLVLNRSKLKFVFPSETNFLEQISKFTVVISSAKATFPIRRSHALSFSALLTTLALNQQKTILQVFVLLVFFTLMKLLSVKSGEANTEKKLSTRPPTGENSTTFFLSRKDFFQKKKR